MKKNTREIPKINYFYLVVMIIFVVFLTVFVFNVNEKYQKRKLETSYFNGFINEVKLEDLNNILIEPSSDLFIFVTKTNDENVYELESKLKKSIKSYDLRDNFIYIDYTDKENELDSLNKVLNSDIKRLPALVYIKNGNHMKTVDSSSEFLKKEVLDQVIDEYEVE